MARCAFTIPFLCIALLSNAAANEPVLDASGAEAFADELITYGDPFNALTFYKLSNSLDSDAKGSLGFRMALCYELGDRFDAAEQAYLDLAGERPDWSARATWRAAMSAREDGRFDEAALHLSDVELEGQGTDLAVRATYMQGVLALHQHQLERAASSFEQFESSHGGHPLSIRASAARGVLSERVPRRSPALAAVFSTLVPGSGQLYAGHPGDAAMAFLSSGILGLWSYSLVRSGIEDERGWRVGTGAALGSFAAFSWASNVVGSARGAKRSNRYLRHQRADEALRETADPALSATAEDVLRDPEIFR